MGLAWLLVFICALGVFHPRALAGQPQGFTTEQLIPAVAGTGEHWRWLKAARPASPDDEPSSADLPPPAVRPVSAARLLTRVQRARLRPHPFGRTAFLRPPLRAPPRG
ncbi:hypothetical protein C7I36_02465 [Zobellella taiwanensis]|jgi:hypothetical protein|uniref:Uncharacterized protein n=2 Tax=Zobellella taiwanensis TaxID=347535 RepID=A0A2P7RAI5_9GAMM|nr:hypothetical protein C7I36_02465 [Zobellella taiwanensis]